MFFGIFVAEGLEAVLSSSPAIDRSLPPSARAKVFLASEWNKRCSSIFASRHHFMFS